MALTEARILKSVEVQVTTKTANVLWADQILRDDVVISETNHRKAYTENQKDEFMTEVEGAESYLTALDWA
jgi:hypothetical protein